MAVYNNTNTMLNKDCRDKTKNTVYLNPNFNRLQGNYTNNSALHVNPKFSHLLSNVQPSVLNKPKIYVNPNFVKSRTCVENAQTIFSTNVSGFQQTTDVKHDGTDQSNENFISQQERLVVSSPTSKSRYCLVRQNTTKVLERPVDKGKTTIQVNKYKSIPLNDIKRNLDGIKSNRPIAASASRRYVGLSSFNASTKSRYKVLNSNIQRSISSDKIRTRSNEMDGQNQLIKLKPRKLKRNLKKNNIPCPMFRKFGKCLRQMRANCEFLHDKKHVVICRNFLKGLCHDKACLLSHDLTTKKMPTCYFYLQGTCTKSDCPYLHVKLSEKVKICPDFLKGYCEKGDQCLQRHVNSHREKGKIVSITSSKTLKRKFIKIKENRIERNVAAETKNTENTELIETHGNNLDCRYYEDYKRDVNATETCEMIKPMRCKLGTLPAFIQL